jgi:predicted secreted protein
VAFVAHCWLNLNTRFAGGGSHPGAHPPVTQALAESGVGIIQMPCPEQRCFGLEKHRFGDLPADAVRAVFKRLVEGVVDDLAEYRDLGFEVVAVIGMDPSPSCGVNAAKGRDDARTGSRHVRGPGKTGALHRVARPGG